MRLRGQPCCGSNDSTLWYAGWKVGRAQFGWHIYRHRGQSPDRWVFHPFLVWDRKR